MAKKYAFKALKCLDESSLNYFTTSYSLAVQLSHSNQYATIDSIITNLENILEHQIEYNKEKFQLYIYKGSL